MYGSSLEDVVGSYPEVLDLWRSNKINSRCVSTALHSKNWGPDKNAMKAEEDDWKRVVDAIVASDSDSDSDITDGCYVPNFGLQGITPSKIWVRADYIRVYEELEMWVKESPMGMPPSAIVVGQPGIGELECSFIACRSH